MISFLVSLLVMAMLNYNTNASVLPFLSSAVLPLLGGTRSGGFGGTREEINMLKNGSFEVDTNGDEMADYWQFAGDSGVTATWSRDKGFKGEYSQKLNCTGFEYISPASHVMLCQINTIQLEKGKWYRISFNAKQEGIRGHTVQVAISNTKLWSNCGLQDSFRVSQDWKPFEFVFQATETITENTRLQFWYTSIGTFWLDDVQLENSEPISKRFTEVLPVTDAVNLIPNSSFECGASGWGSIADLPGWGGNLNQLVGEVDKSTAQNHESSFKIALTPDNLPIYYFDYFQLYRIPIKAPLLANQGWVSVQSDNLYTLSTYMKANSEGLTGILSIQQAFRGTMKKEIQLSTEWKRYSFTFKPQADQVFVAIGLDLNISKQETGTVWIDSIQLEKNSEATPYRPRNMVEIGLETSQLGNLFTFRRATEEQNHYGNEPIIKAMLFNADES
ncbi:MAG: hypothetical protein QG588_852, partial [Candidatus Poribacteria bacterium]|nr:hypothetical protein [Candidatus Poribacteria bacterium]